MHSSSLPSHSGVLSAAAPVPGLSWAPLLQLCSLSCRHSAHPSVLLSPPRQGTGGAGDLIFLLKWPLCCAPVSSAEGLSVLRVYQCCCANSGVGRARFSSWAGEAPAQARVEGRGLLPMAVGSDGVQRFPCGAGIISAHGWAARRMGLLSRECLSFTFSALKVSSGTFQFSFSPPLVLLCGIGEFGRVQPLQPFLLTLLLLFFSHSSSEKGKADFLQWSSLYSLFVSWSCCLF